MITYKKLFDLLEENSITTYDIRQNNLISEATLQRLRHGNVGIQINNLNHLCALFNCQPSDLFEYIPDEESEEWAKQKREALIKKKQK